MTTFLDRWDLRPQERRLVVLFAAVVFVLINLWFVWPRFKDWQLVKDKIGRTETTRRRYNNELARLPEYQTRLRTLEKQGSDVLPAEQAVGMLRAIQTNAAQYHVDITYSGQPTKSTGPNTNSFFEELNLPIKVTAGEGSLVDFFYELVTGSSLIRVKDLILSPGTTGTNLLGSITLAATYLKTNAPRPAVTAKAATNAPATFGAGTKVKSATNVMSKGSTNKPMPAVKPLSRSPSNATTRVSTNKAVGMPSKNK